MLATFKSSDDHYPTPECHPDTRRKLRGDIMGALSPTSGSGMCLLSGMMGMGKSAVARSIAGELSQQGRLAASFFFSRRAGRTHVKNFFPNIAIQLASSIPTLNRAIIAAIKDPFILEGLRHQFQQLITEPIQMMQSFLPSSMVVVVDAIDECNDEEDLIIELITLIADAQKNSLLPVQFFFTSRPEPSITATFGDCKVFFLRDYDAEDDIHLFLRHRFREVAKKRKAVMREVTSTWPLDADIETLVHRASGLFIYAAAVMQFICDKHGNPVQRLKRIVDVEPQGSPSPYTELDQLYTQILDTAPDIDILRKILGVIIVLFNPLPLSELKNMLLSEGGDIFLALEALHSILLIPDEDNGPITMYHTSLQQFLLAKRRSQRYSIDLSMCNSIIARYCLKLLATKFNKDFCALSHPDIFDSMLWYACDYWAVHLCDSSLSDELVADIEKFGLTSLLCWIEALGLRGARDKTMESVRRVNRCIIAKVSGSLSEMDTSS